MIIITITTIIISGSAARTGASRHYYGSITEVSTNEEQVASLFSQREFRICMIQQPEPSGSEAGELRARKRVGESFADKASHSCPVGFIYMP
jgi:hypothetical protein